MIPVRRNKCDTIRIIKLGFRPAYFLDRLSAEVAALIPNIYRDCACSLRYRE